MDGEQQFVDGHVSSFELVPPDRRSEARLALSEPDVPPLPEAFNHALALYPDCPAAWLIEDWATRTHADAVVGTDYFKRLVREHYDSKSVPSTRLRLVPLGRFVRAGRIRVPSDFLETSLVPHYPGTLTDDERSAAESEIRAMYLSLRAIDLSSQDAVDPADAWPAYFWRQNFRISACDTTLLSSVAVPAGEQPDSDEAADDGEPEVSSVADLRDQLVEAGNQLAEALRNAQARLEIDLYAPEPDEVKLGLASRQVRLLRLVLSDPHLWDAAAGAHVLRSLVEGLITTTWLVQRDDSALYEQLRQYGLGKLKLFNWTSRITSTRATKSVRSRSGFLSD